MYPDMFKSFPNRFPFFRGYLRDHSFVTFADRDGMQRAIAGPNIMAGLTLNVNPAAPKSQSNNMAAQQQAGMMMGGMNPMMMGRQWGGAPVRVRLSYIFSSRA